MPLGEIARGRECERGRGVEDKRGLPLFIERVVNMRDKTPGPLADGVPPEIIVGHSALSPDAVKALMN
ncbi:MAG: hypothetical protein LBE65_06920 [Synergistaceae bacterium]|nr:hypothetical protein [Synergistaceae bacterium]